jgi:putative SOS response-associated peptidase YedK
MCGRYMLVAGSEELETRFRVSGAAVERYNAAPAQVLPVVRIRQGARELGWLRWGLTPAWAREDFGGRLINARAESLRERPAFRHLLHRQRCLVPATAFYEWAPTGQGGKVPYRFFLREQRLFAMAGLWDQWCNPLTGELLESFTIITVPANALVAPIHDRMPAILLPEAEELWLEPDAPLPQVLASLRPYPTEEMECAPVSRRLNNPRNDDPSVLVPD